MNKWSDDEYERREIPRLLTPFSPNSSSDSIPIKGTLVRFRIEIPSIGTKSSDGKYTILSHIERSGEIIGFTTTTGENFYASYIGWLGTKSVFSF